jgi:hypothetical protein
MGLKELPLFKPRWEFTLDPRTHARVLVEPTIATAEKRGTGANGISVGTLRFPSMCPECAGPASCVQLMEAGVWIISLWRTSLSAEGLGPREAWALERSVSRARFWYAVPFCEAHVLSGGAVSINEKGGFRPSESPSSDKYIDWRITIQIPSKEYGRLFGEQNGLSGVWVSRPLAIARPLGICLTVIGFVLHFFAKIVPWGILLALASMALVGASYSRMVSDTLEQFSKRRQ